MVSQKIFVAPGSSLLPEGGPGTGGVFVYAPEFSPYRVVSQILLEYAESGFPVLVIDRQDDESKSVMSVLSTMLGLNGSRNLFLTRLTIPISFRMAEEDSASAVGFASVVFDSLRCSPDSRACDLGDANGVLYVMTYPNENARLFEAGRLSELAIDSNGRYARKR